MATYILRPLIICWAFVLPCWIIYRYIIFVLKKRQGLNVDIKKEMILLVFVTYLCAVLAVTVAPVPISRLSNPSQPNLNFKPFIYTYHQFIISLSDPDENNLHAALENIFGNILMFIPIGILLPMIFVSWRSVKKVTLVCFVFSCLIEFTQFILGKFGTFRTVDIDDVILNTLGGFLGALLFMHLMLRFFNKNYTVKN